MPDTCTLYALFEGNTAFLTQFTSIHFEGNPEIEISVPIVHWETAFTLLANLPNEFESPIRIRATDNLVGETVFHVHHPVFRQYSLSEIFDPKPRHTAPASIGLTGLLIKTLWLACGCWVKLEPHHDDGPMVVLRLPNW